MTIYRITSQAGVEYGEYEAESPAAALLALHRDAGYGPDRVWLDGDTLAWADEDERQAMGDVDDWQIEEL